MNYVSCDLHANGLSSGSETLVNTDDKDTFATEELGECIADCISRLAPRPDLAIACAVKALSDFEALDTHDHPCVEKKQIDALVTAATAIIRAYEDHDNRVFGNYAWHSEEPLAATVQRVVETKDRVLKKYGMEACCCDTAPECCRLEPVEPQPLVSTVDNACCVSVTDFDDLS